MPDIDMAALALEVVGEFSKLQETVGGLVSLYVEKRAPSLAAFLKDERVLDRMRDEQRPRLVLAIADELKTPGDLSKFKDVFHRVKSVRDVVGHAVHMELIDADTLRLQKNYWVNPLTEKDEPGTVTVTRQQLTARLHEARWLLQHVQYIIYAVAGRGRVYLGAKEIAFVQPPADPAHWDGQMFIFTA